MGYDYYALLEEVRLQGDVLDRIELMMSQQQQDFVSFMLKMDRCIELLSILAIVGFGVFAFSIVMKWVKR